MTYTHVFHIFNDLQLSPGDLVFLERSDRTKRFGEVLKGAGTHIYTCTKACTWTLHLLANHTPCFFGRSSCTQALVNV
jgi:hypothetical protein